MAGASRGDSPARTRTAVEALRILRVPESDDPFDVLREDLREWLDRPKPRTRLTRDLLHLAAAVNTLAAEAEAASLLNR